MPAAGGQSHCSFPVVHELETENFFQGSVSLLTSLIDKRYALRIRNARLHHRVTMQEPAPLKLNACGIVELCLTLYPPPPPHTLLSWVIGLSNQLSSALPLHMVGWHIVRASSVLSLPSATNSRGHGLMNPKLKHSAHIEDMNSQLQHSPWMQLVFQPMYVNNCSSCQNPTNECVFNYCTEY